MVPPDTSYLVFEIAETKGISEICCGFSVKKIRRAESIKRMSASRLVPQSDTRNCNLLYKRFEYRARV